MSRPAIQAHRSRPLAVLLTLVLGLVALGLGSPLGFPARGEGDATTTTAARAGANPVTPGNFKGYGFDQCLAPTQKAMNRWLNHSPFLAVGIYISGDSRACRNQPNLTPGWISTQLRKGWRLLPITLGPQASCQPRFPRYADDFKISPKPGRTGAYSTARRQGTAEANRSVNAARLLGIAASSTLWYDLEGFNHSDTRCRESALSFLSGWTKQVRAWGYKAGVYSSAGSGIKMLDDARVNRPGKFALPDMIWVARWDGVANTSTSYIRADGWRPGGRVKQYMGGHDEVWGGVRINIDRNFLEVGRGSVAPPESRCGGVQIGFRNYVPLHPRRAGRPPASPALVKALQCQMKERELYAGKVDGVYNARLLAAVNAWQRWTKSTVSKWWSRKNWMTIFAYGNRPVLKFGSAGHQVRRVQRALNASRSDVKLPTHGVYTQATHNAVRAWQKRVGVPASGVMNPVSWKALMAAKR